MATYTPMYNARAIADKRIVGGEAHVVGENEANRVWLYEVPVPDGTLTVEIAGVPLTEVEAAPGPGEFRVHYDGELAGAIDFNAAQAAASVVVDYSGIGSPLPAHILTALQTQKVDRDGSVGFTGAPVPAVTLTTALGSTTFRWNNVYTGGINASGNATIGGTLGVTGLITGTLGTAAQPNVTSLGTLSSLAVSGGAAIGGALNLTGTAAIQEGGVERGRIVGGLLKWGFTSTPAGSAAGEIYVANGKKFGCLSTSGAILGFSADSATDFMLNINTGAAVGSGGYVRIPRFTVGTLPAAAAAMDGTTLINATDHRFCYWSGGQRFALTGTPF